MLYPSYSDIDEGQSIAQHFLRLSCLISLSWIVVLRVKLAKPKHLFLMSSLLWLQERSLLISCLLLCCSWFYQRHTSVSLGPSSLNSSMGTHIGLPLTGLVTHFLHVALPPYLTWGYFQPAVTWYTKNINIFLHKLHKKYKICLFENSIFQSDKLHNIKPSKSPGIEVWGTEGEVREVSKKSEKFTITMHNNTSKVLGFSNKNLSQLASSRSFKRIYA